MSTFTKLTYHVVFSTKYRHPLIQTALQKRLYEYIGGIIRAQNGHLIEIGGVEEFLELHDIAFEHRYLFEAEHYG